MLKQSQALIILVVLHGLREAPIANDNPADIVWEVDRRQNCLLCSY